jgi:acetyltransferase-like isoleucine patch superfamily enzyme
MKKEIKEFLKSKEMVLYLPRDYSKDIISQWTTCRNIFVAPINFLLSGFAKIIPSSKWASSFYRTFFRMKIGKNVGFAQIEPDYLLPEAIEIGDDSAFGWQTKFLTHEFTQDSQRFGKIKIGKNVLIGAFSTIRGGVKIGDNSIVAMCSFVNKDIPPNELWGGVPAKRIKKLNKAL